MRRPLAASRPGTRRLSEPSETSLPAVTCRGSTCVPRGVIALGRRSDIALDPFSLLRREEPTVLGELAVDAEIDVLQTERLCSPARAEDSAEQRQLDLRAGELDRLRQRLEHLVEILGDAV